MEEFNETQTCISKLPIRNNLDPEDKNISDLQDDIAVQINNIKEEVLDADYHDHGETTLKSPFKFSIKVEVEEYIEESRTSQVENYNDMMIVPVKRNIFEEDKTLRGDNDPEILSIVETTNVNTYELEHNTLFLHEGDEKEVCSEANSIAESSDNIADKVLAIKVRNLCSVLAKPKQTISLLDTQIYAVYKQWRTWCTTTQSDEQPLFYKCYMCSKSWWHLGPFIEHAKLHAAQVYIIYLEACRPLVCNIILANNEHDTEKFIYTEGDCWRCFKPYSFHDKTKETNQSYKCNGCDIYFYKCNLLVEHENKCSKITRNESAIICIICSHKFDSYTDLSQHLYTSHSVRSDLFSPNTHKKCSICNEKYYICNFHRCSKIHNYGCELCCYRFTSQLSVTSHGICTKINVRCRVCDISLNRQCMEMEHYLTHTDKFKLVHKCSQCTDAFLFWERPSMVTHQNYWHKNTDVEKCFEPVLIPTVFLSKLKRVEHLPISLVPSPGVKVADAKTAGNHIKDIPPVYIIKEEFVEPVNNENDEGYMFEVDKSSYTELMTNLIQIQEPMDGSIEYKDDIKVEPIDSYGKCRQRISDDTDDDDESRLIIDTKRKRKNLVTWKRTPKIYSCCKCPFKGIHRDYKEHVLKVCVKRKNKKKLNISASLKPCKMYRCSNCQVTYFSLNEYLRHFANTHGYQEHRCPVCSMHFGEKFEQKLKLDSHFTVHLKQMFLKVKVIKNNNETSYAMEFLHECKECKEVVETLDFFKHWESHYRLKPPNEVQEFENVTTVLTTADKHTNIDAKTLIEKLMTVRCNYTERGCNICHRNFDRVNDSKRHVIEHLLIDAYKNKIRYSGLRCQICNEKFTKPDEYKKHLREHASLPIYTCDLCNKSFSDSSNFVKHKKLHNITVLVCDICNNKYQMKASLEKHMQIHNATQPIQCTQCPKIYFSQTAYNKHVRTTHEKYKAKFRCVVCNTKFYTLREKWDHMWLVHEERSIEADCPLCNKSFRKHQDVKKHLREDHTIVTGTQVNVDVEDYLQNNSSLSLASEDS